MSGRPPPRVICESAAVADQVEAWQANPADRRYAIRYDVLVSKLEVGGHLAGDQFTKLQGCLWEFDVYHFRFFFGMAKGNRIALTSVVEKKKQRLKQQIYDHHEGLVAAHIAEIEATPSGCPQDKEDGN